MSQGHLLQVVLGEGVEHAEAVVEVGLHVAVDLPGEAEGHPQDVMHVVCGSAMGQVSCANFVHSQ